MDGKILSVAKSFSDGPSFVNCVTLCPGDFPNHKAGTLYHVSLTFRAEKFFYTASMSTTRVAGGSILVNQSLFKWVPFQPGDKVRVAIVPVDATLSSIVLQAHSKDPMVTTALHLDGEKVASEFKKWFKNKPLSMEQNIIITFQDKELHLVVKELKGPVKNKKAAECCLNGICQNGTTIIFQNSKDSKVQIKLKGKSTKPPIDDGLTGDIQTLDEGGLGDASSSPEKTAPSIFNPQFDCQNIGIGGLDAQFRTIIRKLASRLLPPDVFKKTGCKHVKGVLLYGPPGTGKTLMARQLAQMLNCVDPKIACAEKMLGKYVGESELNTSAIFLDAEDDEKRLGSQSRLHVIIFDELDALCKKRSDGISDTDSVVNTLLRKLDGLEQLNNLFVICMTNRKDLIDPALLRPGRIEMQIEFGLPDQAGRQNILNIHTSELKENNMLGEDVDLLELAVLTKNFSGAEIEGLVRAAMARAIEDHLSISSTVKIDPEVGDKLKISMEKCQEALRYDIEPASTNTEKHLDCFIAPGIIRWGDPVYSLYDQGHSVLQKVKTQSGIATVLLEGLPGAGKTALAAQWVKDLGFPVVQICFPCKLSGLSESEKCAHIRKMFDDAAKYDSSCILLDDLEGIVDYLAPGLPFLSAVLGTLKAFINGKTPAMDDRKLLVICTTSQRKLLEEWGMLSSFRTVINMPYLTNIQHLETVLAETDVFSKSQIDELMKQIGSRRISMPIKELIYLIDLAKATDEYFQVNKFIKALESGRFIYYSSS